MTRRDEVQLRMEIDGKQAISELGKQELAAYEYRQELKQISDEQKQLEAESKKIDKVRERYEKLTKQIQELEAAGKSNTKEYDKALGKLGKVSEALRSAEKAQRDLTENQKRYTETSKNLDETKAKITNLRAEMGLAGMTMRQLRQYQRDLSSQMDAGVTKGTAKYDELKRKIQEVNKRIADQKAEVRGTTSAWSMLRSEAAKFGVLALGYLGAQEIFGRIQNLVKGSAELSDALSDVQKTTGLTNDEVIDLSKTLGDFNSRSARKELLGMAEIAGRLGIQGKKDIEGFVRAADMVSVSLGDSLKDVETVMRDLGKLTSTYNIKDAYGVEESLLRVGSAINELGMASVANEGNIVDFTKRMGGIAPLAKITIQDIMGMGATLDALGQTSEVSSTALSKLFINMAKNAKEYARFAKMEVADFVQLMNTDANEAFIKVLEGVKDNSAGITELAGTLGDLGEDGGRVIGVLGTLANKVQFLREQQELSNNAFFKSTSIFEEFQTKNENLAANLMKVQKAFNGWFVSTDFMKFLEATIGVMAKWVAVPLSETMDKDRASMNLLYRQIVDVNTSSKDRIKLINEMKTIYPDLLGSINAETVSNDELGRSLKRVNDHLINKIILQQQDEEIADQNARAAKAKKTQLEIEEELMVKMQKAAEKYNLEIEEGTSLIDAATKLANEIGPNLNIWDLLNGSGESDEIFAEIQKLNGIISSVKKVEGETNLLLEEREALIKKLGMAMNSDFVSGAGNMGRAGLLAAKTSEENPNPSIPGGTPEEIAAQEKAQKEAADKLKAHLEKLEEQWKSYQEKIVSIQRDYALKQMPEQDAAIERNRQTYRVLEEELVKFWEEKIITTDELEARLQENTRLRLEEDARIRAEYRTKFEESEREYDEKEAEKKLKAEEERKQAELEHFEATLSNEELQLAQLEAFYLEKIELAKKYGWDVIALETQLAKDRAALEKAINDKLYREEVDRIMEKMEIYQEFGAGAIGIMEGIAAFQSESNKFAKETAIFRALIASGEAIASMIAAFTVGTFTPLQLAAKVAAGIGIIMTNIATAKRTIDSANEPEAPTADAPKTPVRRGGPTRAKKSFYFGGPTGDGMGFGDEYGEYAGYVHRHEYVIPQSVRQEPIVRMQIEPLLEALRTRSFSSRSFYNGGETSPMPTPSPTGGNPGMGSDPEMKALMRILIQKVDAWPREVRGKWVITDFEKAQDEKDYLDKKYKV